MLLLCCFIPPPPYGGPPPFRQGRHWCSNSLAPLPKGGCQRQLAGGFSFKNKNAPVSKETKANTSAVPLFLPNARPTRGQDNGCQSDGSRAGLPSSVCSGVMFSAICRRLAPTADSLQANSCGECPHLRNNSILVHSTPKKAKCQCPTEDITVFDISYYFFLYCPWPVGIDFPAQCVTM